MYNHLCVYTKYIYCKAPFSAGKSPGNEIVLLLLLLLLLYGFFESDFLVRTARSGLSGILSVGFISSLKQNEFLEVTSRDMRDLCQLKKKARRFDIGYLRNQNIE